jgi:hypothetical protein
METCKLYKIFRLQEHRSQSKSPFVILTNRKENLYEYRIISEKQATLLRLKGHYIEELF